MDRQNHEISENIGKLYHIPNLLIILYYMILYTVLLIVQQKPYPKAFQNGILGIPSSPRLVFQLQVLYPSQGRKTMEKSHGRLLFPWMKLPFISLSYCICQGKSASENIFGFS